MQEPQAIALDPDAPLLWIADAGNDRLRSLRLGGGEMTTHMLPQPLHGPAGLAVGAGAVWIADTDAHAVLRVDPKTGAVQHVADRGMTRGPARGSPRSNPSRPAGA